MCLCALHDNIVLFEVMNCPAMHRLASSVWWVAKRSH